MIVCYLRITYSFFGLCGFMLDKYSVFVLLLSSFVILVCIYSGKCGWFPFLTFGCFGYWLVRFSRVFAFSFSGCFFCVIIFSYDFIYCAYGKSVPGMCLVSFRCKFFFGWFFNFLLCGVCDSSLACAQILVGFYFFDFIRDLGLAWDGALCEL